PPSHPFPYTTLFRSLIAQSRQAALGVAHGRGVVAVERSEISRAVDQGIAQRKGLRHAHERFVESGVAVRMVVAHDVADDLGALRSEEHTSELQSRGH